MVAEFTGVRIDNDELGGSAAHARDTRRGDRSSCADAEAADAGRRATCWPTCRRTPTSSRRGGPRDDPPDRLTPEAGELLPTSSTGSYDVRDVIRRSPTTASCSSCARGWAPNLVTAFAHIGGRPVGIVANQPLAIAGTLDIPASQKGARFVAFCDAFNLPILTLVDTPGFYPGKDLEWRGMIRHGAQLVFAYGRATVPRICRDPAQELRRRLHRDGLQAHGERPVPGLAGSGAGGHGRRAGRRHLAAQGQRRRSGRHSRPTTATGCSTPTSPPTVAWSTR